MNLEAGVIPSCIIFFQQAPPPDSFMDDVEDITPSADGAYDLGPFEEDLDAKTYRRWMIYFQRKNNSLMKRILRAITGVCFQVQSLGAARKDQVDKEDQATREVRRAAKKQPMEQKLSPTGVKRGRNMRYVVQSNSEETE